MSDIRVLFIGQSLPLSIATFNSIYAEYKIVFVVDFIGNSKKNLLKELAKENDIPYLAIRERQNQNILKDIFFKYNIDISFICSMPCLLLENLISIPKYGTINTHPSLLPNYKGPNPKFWVYYNSEKKGGVTIHYVDKGEDTGNIIAQYDFNIPVGYSGKEYDTSIVIAAKAIATLAIDRAIHGDKGAEQFKSKTYTRSRRLKKEDTFDECLFWDIFKLFHLISGTNFLPQKMIPPKITSIFFNIKVFKVKRESKIKKKTGVYYFWKKGMYYQHRDGRIFFKLTLKGANRIFKKRK